MHKIPEVENAWAIMNEASDWGVWRWLTEKKRVREAADRATAALAEANRKVKQAWSEELKKAYAESEAEAAAESDPKMRRRYQKAKEDARDVDAKVKAAAKRVKEADDEAARATDDAENTFAEAESRLSSSMAREGTRKALESYDLREKAIRRAEAAAKAAGAAG